MKKLYTFVSYIAVLLLTVVSFTSCDMEDEIELDNEAVVSEIKVDGVNAEITVKLTGILSKQPYVENNSENSSLKLFLNDIFEAHCDRISKMSDGSVEAKFFASQLTPMEEFEITLRIETIYLGYPNSDNIGIPSPKRMQITPKNNKFSTSIDYSTPMKAIDLGLSVLWGERDLGVPASSTIPFLVPWYDKNSDFSTDLDIISISGTKYDLATQYLGDGWRTPTAKEWQELIDNCMLQSYTVQSALTGEIKRYYMRVNGKGAFLGYHIDLLPIEPEKTDYWMEYWTSDRETNIFGTLPTYGKGKVNTCLISSQTRTLRTADYYSLMLLRPVKDK